KLLNPQPPMFDAFIGLEPQQKSGAEILVFQFGFGRRDRFPNINSWGEMKHAMKLAPGRNQQRRSGDSHHNMILAVQLDGSSDQVGISRVSPSPQRVTDYDHSIRAGRFLFRIESPTERRRDAEEIKEIRRDPSASYSLRFAIPGQIPSVLLQGGD